MKTTLKITYTSSRQSKTRLFKMLKQFNCLSTLFRKYLKYYFFRFCTYNFLILHLVHYLILYIQPLIYLFQWWMWRTNWIPDLASLLLDLKYLLFIYILNNCVCTVFWNQFIPTLFFDIFWNQIENPITMLREFYLSLCALSW